MRAVRSPTWLGAAQICPKARAAHLAKETAGIVAVSPALRAGTAPWAQPRSACGSAGRALLLPSSFASLEEIITLHRLKMPSLCSHIPCLPLEASPKQTERAAEVPLCGEALGDSVSNSQRLPHSSIINGSQWRSKKEVQWKQNVFEHTCDWGLNLSGQKESFDSWLWFPMSDRLVCVPAWQGTSWAQPGLSLPCCRQMCCCVPGGHACELGQLEINAAASSCWQQPGPLYQHLVLDPITLHFPTHPVREDIMRGVLEEA